MGKAVVKLRLKMTTLCSLQKSQATTSLAPTCLDPRLYAVFSVFAAHLLAFAGQLKTFSMFYFTILTVLFALYISAYNLAIVILNCQTFLSKKQHFCMKYL